MIKTNLALFNPKLIPYQYKVIYDLRTKFRDLSGCHEILLSGSVGSAKSILLAHLALTHALQNPGARILIGRESLPDIKSTIFRELLDHIKDDLTEGRDYFVRENIADIRFSNGSEIISKSWGDGHFEKMRSLKLSAAIIEEITETKVPDAYSEIRMRLGRLPNIKECFIAAATNPDDPDHWVHKYWIDNPTDLRRTYFSSTFDNPFLPSWYIEQLKQDLDPKMAERMIYGRWISLNRERCYYAYEESRNYLKVQYKVAEGFPILINFDFNIGVGKPFSVCLSQFLGGVFHIYDEVIVHGVRTMDALEELASRGHLNHKTSYIVHGDAAGKSRSTNSNRSDYDIISQYLSNYKTPEGQKLMWKLEVPEANPPIRTRQNIVNAYCYNDLNQVRLIVYEKCKTVNLGLKNVRLKSGAQYTEDDSNEYQHVVSALGYGLVYEHNKARVQAQVKPFEYSQRR